MPKLSSLASATKSVKPPSGKSISNKSVKPTRILSKLTVNDSDLESVTESSESGSSSEEEQVEEKKSTIIPKKTNRIKKSPSVSSSESDSDAESETGNGDDASSVKGDDESSDDELPQNPADARALKSNKSVIPPPKSANTAASNIYVPPSGFKALELSNDSTSFDLLKPTNIEGKQIWYITAPAAVSINTIKKFTLQDIQKEKPVLAIEEQDYGFVSERPDELAASKIMLPEQNGKQYRISQRSFDQVLHLQQIVKLANKTSTAKATIPTASQPRPQPSGLKMRFKPLGFGSGQPGTIGESASEASNSDVEMEDAPRTFRAPAPAPPESDSDDSSHSDNDHTGNNSRIESQTQASSKSKKRKLLDATNGNQQKKVKTTPAAPPAAPSIFGPPKITPIPPPKPRTSSNGLTSTLPVKQSSNTNTDADATTSERRKEKKEKKKKEKEGVEATGEEKGKAQKVKKEKDGKKRTKIEGGENVHIKSEAQKAR